MANPFSSELMQGVESVLLDHGYDCFITASLRNAEREKSALGPRLSSTTAWMAFSWQPAKLALATRRWQTPWNAALTSSQSDACSITIKSIT